MSDKQETYLSPKQLEARSEVEGTLTLLILNSDSHWWYRTGCNQPDKATCPYYQQRTSICAAPEVPAMLSVTEYDKQIVFGTSAVIYCAKGESFN